MVSLGIYTFGGCILEKVSNHFLSFLGSVLVFPFFKVSFGSKNLLLLNSIPFSCYVVVCVFRPTWFFRSAHVDLLPIRWVNLSGWSNQIPSRRCE